MRSRDTRGAKTPRHQTAPILGAHESIGGGVSTAIERAQKIEAQALQLFTKNSNQWKGKLLTSQEAEEFREKRSKAGIQFAFAHDSYLINLASPDKSLRARSIAAFLDEMDRAELLDLDFIVFHPGAHMGDGIGQGCGRVADAMSQVLEKRPKQNVRLLIENAAGQGTTLGRTFEELAQIREGVEDKARVGFCFDTCHAFAAGYELRTKEGYEATMKELNRTVGLDHVRAFHLNDSKKGVDCRVDRHQHIGKGEIGLEAFRMLLNDPRFSGRPMVLETPKSHDLHEDIENLSTLRGLID
ncbi:MAG TPA: deoxyribonuclease IV [Bdellovibrionota bacterium]|nr:deoxyribonuclease IV [Bdellovibrionota bacterium]